MASRNFSQRKVSAKKKQIASCAKDEASRFTGAERYRSCICKGLAELGQYLLLDSTLLRLAKKKFPSQAGPSPAGTLCHSIGLPQAACPRREGRCLGC